ncbi:MAG: hypothetical protein A2170_06930, partial [Deltaproteobacteria bacterium RBG_13_53_10]
MMHFEPKKSDRIRNDLARGKRGRKRWFLVGGIFLVTVGLVAYLTFSSKQVDLSVEDPAATQSSSEEAPHQAIEGEVEQKSSLFQSLAEKNIPVEWINLIVSKLKPHVDFRKIKGGTYRIITDVKGQLVKFVFEPGPTEIYEIEKDSQGYTAQRKEVPLDFYLTEVEGEIRSSLFEAMEKIGEGDQLVIAFAEILAWEIDFYKDIREGDRFRLVVEKVYKGEQFIQYGTIHGVEYRGKDGSIRGIEYRGEYYDESGASLRKAFLKSPLRFNRISSRFSRARKHPILGGLRPHLGVDYAAAVGTPIWAVADGTVFSCRWNGGFGKQVVLRHPNGYQTYYGHLSRYGRGIKKGARVKQKQIIGYVGSTGLSTGPHLDYRLVRDGRFKNPLKEIFPAGQPVRRREMDAYQRRRDEVVEWLQT